MENHSFMTDYTKIHPVGEPLSYNSFRENNDINEEDGGTDHNTFTSMTILNAKDPDTEEQQGIISKVIFNDHIVHEDRFLMVPSTEMNVMQVQSMYPPPDHVFTSYMIIPSGKTINDAFTKLIKNTLYRITRKGRVLLMDHNVSDEAIPYGNQDIREFDDILVLGTLVEKMDWSEFEFVHLSKEEFSKWNQFYQDQKNNLGEDLDQHQGFLKKIYDYSHGLDCGNDLIYSFEFLEDVVISFFANGRRLRKLNLKLKVDHPESLQNVLKLNTTLKTLTFDIKLEKLGNDSYCYTCPKPIELDNEINEMSGLMKKIMDSFQDPEFGAEEEGEPESEDDLEEELEDSEEENN